MREKVLAETENRDTGVALSLRYRGLTELPESLDRLSELQCLDVTRESIDRAAGMGGKLTESEKIVGRWEPINDAARMAGKLRVPGGAPCRWEPLDRSSKQDRPACEPYNVTPL